MWRSSSSLTAKAICFVLITVSSNFSRPSSCSASKAYPKNDSLHRSQIKYQQTYFWRSYPKKNSPLIICLWRPTMPELSKPVVLLLASAEEISGPSKLSLCAKVDMFNVEAIWVTFDLKVRSISFRRFISFSVLCTVMKLQHICKYANKSNKN